MRAWICILLLSGCSIIDFDAYDYDTHRSAHIGLKKIDADVHKVRGGMMIGKKIKFAAPRKNRPKKTELLEPCPLGVFPERIHFH